MVNFKDKTYGASITGIDVKREIETTDFKHKIIKGRFLEIDEENTALVGAKLAENLKLNIGDEVAVVAQGRDGSIGAKLLRVVGVINTGMIDLDRSKIITSILSADELFSMGGRVTTIVIYFPEGKVKLNKAKDKIKSILSDGNFEVLDWKEIMPELLELIEFDRVSGYLMYALLIIIIAFGLLNTIYMSIFERKKEIAVLRAIGMKAFKIGRMIILESLLMSTIGSAAGFVFSYPIILYFKLNPIKLSKKITEIYESYSWVPELHFKLSFEVMAYITAAILFISVVMAIFPAIKVSKEELAIQLKFEK
ncbi:MAG: FtsX-like permease family protein [Acidobacteriota bacterium]